MLRQNLFSSKRKVHLPLLGSLVLGNYKVSLHPWHREAELELTVEPESHILGTWEPEPQEATRTYNGPCGASLPSRRGGAHTPSALSVPPAPNKCSPEDPLTRCCSNVPVLHDSPTHRGNWEPLVTRGPALTKARCGEAL